MKSFSSLLFAIAIVMTMTITMIMLSSSVSSVNALPIKSQQQKHLFDNINKQKNTNIRQQQNVKSSIAALAAAARPTSTLPFIPRAAMTILQRDQDDFAYGASTVALDIPTRYMWGWNDPNNHDEPEFAGYCGSTAFQSSLLMFGAWVSAERVRYADGGEELLIGVNDVKAAKNLDLKYESYDAFKSTGQDYLDDFVKPNIQAGNPVVLGFYEVVKSGGDSDYDHIMIIRGVELDSKGNVVGIYFNDFHTQEVRYLGKFMKGNGNTNDKFISTRKNCRENIALQHPYHYCIPSAYQYSIALQGLNIDNADGVYTRAINPVWTEPDWGKEDGKNQKPISVAFSLIINGNLKKGDTYVVKQFNDAADLNGGGQVTPKWTYEFTQAKEDNEAVTLTTTEVPNLNQMSDGEYYWVTSKK